MRKSKVVKKSDGRETNLVSAGAEDFTDLWLRKGKLNLELAGIMFVNAVLQLKQGEKFYQKLEVEKQKYANVYNERAKKYDKSSEAFYTHILPKLRNIEVIYEPTVRYFSTCKILLVCCAETFINEVADIKLSGRQFSEFDKLSIVGKWIFIQDILKLKRKLTLDENPLQDFISLVSERNKLIHFKGLKKDLSPLEIPDFLESLKLSSKECLKNMIAVRDLIRSLSLEWIGSYGPDWLGAYKEKYRNPCFYSGNRETTSVLISIKYDKDLYD